MNDLMIDDNEKQFNLSDVRREADIMAVLRFTLRGTDGGRGVSIAKACKLAGVPIRTWYDWVEQGHVAAPLRRISEEISGAAQELILPNLSAIVQNLVSIALGQSPEGREDVPQYKDMIAAFDRLTRIVPIEPLGAMRGQSEQDFIESYQPKANPLTIYNNQTLNFLYTGGQQGAPVMGEMDDVVDGELNSY